MNNRQKHKLKVFKLKDKIIRGVMKDLLDNYEGYDHFDISLTKEFYLVEELISLIVDNIESKKITPGAYERYCEHCDNNQGES